MSEFNVDRKSIVGNANVRRGFWIVSSEEISLRHSKEMQNNSKIYSILPNCEKPDYSDLAVFSLCYGVTWYNVT